MLQSVTVTEMEKIIISTLSDSLFNKTFTEARKTKSSEEWPPASYFQDSKYKEFGEYIEISVDSAFSSFTRDSSDPGDIIDLNELSSDSLHTVTLPRAQPVGGRKRRWSSRYRRSEGQGV